MACYIKSLFAVVFAALELPASAVVTVLDGMQSFSVTRGFYTPAIRVKVTDDQGHPAAGRAVSPNLFLPSSCCTDSDGIVTIPPALAPSAGKFTITLSVAQLGSTTLAMNVLPYGPLLEVSVVEGDGQKAMQDVSISGIRFRLTRAGTPIANAVLTCDYDLGPWIQFDSAKSITSVSYSKATDGAGELVIPPFHAIDGHGKGTYYCAAKDDIENTYVFAKATYYVTYPDGSTWAPIAPLWWDPAQSGWGLSVSQHQERVFPVVFTYRNGAPIWYLLDGSWPYGFGESYVGWYNEYRGAPYYAFDSTKVTAQKHLFGYFAFSVKNSLTKADLHNTCVPMQTGSLPPPCYSTGSSVVPFSFAASTPQAERGLTDIWWGGPSQSGWGISIAEDHGNLFLAWFTYGADGMPTWFAMPEGRWTDANTWTGPVVRSTGDGVPFAGDAGTTSHSYAATKVGDFTIRFSGTTAATFTYNVNGHVGTLNLQRFDY